MKQFDRVRVDDPCILNGCDAVILEGPFADGTAYVAAAIVSNGEPHIVRTTVGVREWTPTEGHKARLEALGLAS